MEEGGSIYDSIFFLLCPKPGKQRGLLLAVRLYQSWGWGNGLFDNTLETRCGEECSKGVNTVVLIVLRCQLC